MTPRARRRDLQAGITVLEMTVVVALLGLVLALAMQGLSSFQASVAATEIRQQNLDEARVAMAVLTKDLRTATSFTMITPREVIFQGHLNTGATEPAKQVRLYVDLNEVLWEEVTSFPYTPGTTTTRAVGRGVVVPPTPTDPTDDLFSYFDKDGGAATLTTVTSVVITLWVDLPSGAPVPPTVLSSRVFLPNVAAATSEA
jgi:type II secretory pathway pseudopilin PulG